MSSKKSRKPVKSSHLSKKFKKIGLTAIAGTLAATSYANALIVIGDDVWGDGIQADAAGSITDPSANLAVDLQDEKLTINVAGAAVALGAVTAGTGADANSDLVVVQNTTAGMNVTIASIAATVFDFNIDGKTDATAAVNVTVTGNTALAGGSIVRSLNATNDIDTTVNFNGTLALASGKDLVITGAAKSDATVKIKGAGTSALQDVNLDDSTGLAILDIAGTAAQVISGTIDSVGTAEGTVRVTNTSAGGVTVSGAMGTGAGIKEVITVASSKLTASGATLTSATVTNAGTLLATGATSFLVDTVANSGTLSINGATIKGDAGNAVQTITNTGTVNLIGEATVTATATIVGAGTLNIYDGSGGAAIVNTISGVIGADGTNATAINVGALDGADTDAGRVIFSSNVFADAVTIASGADSGELSSATFVDNLTNNTLTLTTAAGGDAQAVFAAGSGATTIVTGSINGAGDVTTEGADVSTTTFNGNLGTGTALKLFHIGDADIADINLDLTATNITFDDATSELEITGASAQTVTGLMDGDTTGGIGILQISQDATIVSNIGATQELADIILADGKSATFSGIVKTEDLLLGSTATGGSSVTLAQDGHIIGDRTQGDTGILTFGKNLTLTLDDTIVAGETIFDVDFTDSATATNGVVVTSGTTIKLPGNFTSGAITLVDGDVALAVTAAELLLLDAADTALSNYSITHTDSLKDVTITATDKSSTEVAKALGTTKNSGAAFTQARAAIVKGGTAAELDTITNTLNAVGFSAKADTDLALQVAPQTEMFAGSTVAAQGVSGSVQGIMSNRMASLRSGDAYAGSGMSAGGAMSAKSGFVQAFGSKVEQKNRTAGSGIQSGFDSDSSGIAIGFDGISDAGTTVGLSLSTSQTDLDSKGTGKAKSDMDTYTASIYMDKATDVGYVEGSLTYGVSENTTSRRITATGLKRNLSGAYDSSQISLNVGVGIPNDVGMGFVTPFASFTGTKIDTDAYTEKSSVANDALRLKIAQDDVTSVVGSVGVKYHNVTDFGTPMILLALNNEFGDTTINSSNTYQGGGTAFKTSTEVEKLSATVGVGYSLGNDYTSIEFSYEADANQEKYLSHGGSIKIVGKF